MKYSKSPNDEAYKAILETLERREIPEAYPPAGNDPFEPRQLDIDDMIYRTPIVEASSWSLIAYEWVRPLAAWIGNRKCLEIMCGRGVLTKALRDCGVSVVATDDKSMALRQWWEKMPWIEVEQLDAVEAIEKYGPGIDIVICSWPPYQSPAAYNALVKMREVALGAVMLYIGELNPYTNADEDFFNSVIPVEDDGFDEAIRAFKQMNGIRDIPILFR